MSQEYIAGDCFLFPQDLEMPYSRVDSSKMCNVSFDSVF